MSGFGVVAYWHIFKPNREIERGEEIQESKARCPGPQEEGDEESDSGEEEKETSAKASARSGGSVAAARGRFRRQDRRSIDPAGGQRHPHHLYAANRGLHAACRRSPELGRSLWPFSADEHQHCAALQRTKPRQHLLDSKEPNPCE